MIVRFEAQVVRFSRWVVRWRWPVVIASLVLAALAGSGAKGLFFDTSYTAFFGGDNPQLTAYEALQEIYTKNDNILFVVAPADGEVFTPRTLEAVEELTAAAWRIPYALRVDAVTNFQHTTAEEDDLTVQDLVEGAARKTPEELVAAREVALAEPFLRRRLIDDDAKVTGVNVTIQFPGESSDEFAEATVVARELADQIRADYPEIAVHLTGVAMLNNAFMEISQSEMARLAPVMFLVMFVVMLVALRSFTGTLATMVVVLLSVVVAMGLAGFYKVGLTPPSAQAPIIIMTLAIADSIHILMTMLKGMRRGLSKSDAIIESMRVNTLPVLLTSFSTVVGFLSMNFSAVPPFHHLGNTTAAGVVAAFLFSVTLLPALASIIPMRVRISDKAPSRFLERFADLVIRRRTAMLYGSALVVLALAAFIPSNILDDRFVEYFDNRVEFRVATDFTSDNLTGIYQVEYSIGSGEEGGISEPEYLSTVDGFAAWFRAQPGVTHVNTFTDVMKRVNRTMHGDDEAYYSLPESRELAAQYLLLYELSLPYGLDLNNQINVDKSATRFTVTLDDVSSTEIRALATRGEEWLAREAKPDMAAVGSGPIVMFAYISGINIRSMLVGSVVALVVISLLMIVALQSLRLGLISLIPNLVPGAVAFGIWGLTTGVVNIGLSVVLGLTLGIVVDDSIHFLSKYQRARREDGLSPEDAVRHAFANVGQALAITSLILIAGFSVLATSAFDMNASMGRLTAITLAIALAADLLFLPPLLMKLDRRTSRAILVPATNP
jgi:hypothetical protein